MAHVIYNIHVCVHIYIYIYIYTCADVSELGSATYPVSQDSCKWAEDGICNEPNTCYVGTDTTDCRVLHTKLGYCHGGHDELNSTTLNNGESWDWGTCWAACLVKHPDTLVSINGPGTLFWCVGRFLVFSQVNLPPPS